MTDTTSTKTGAFIATWKDLVAVSRDTLILVLALLLVLFPNTFNSLLVNAGFDEGSIVGFKWKAKLVESDQALKDAQANSNDLATQNDKLLKTLSDIKASVSDLDIKRRVTDLEEMNQKLKVASTKVEASVQTTIASMAPLVEKAQLAQATGGAVQWGVVYGGDADVDSAKQEIGPVAKKFEIGNAAIYFRQNSYRSVAVTSDRTEAEQLLFKAKTHRRDAYIVNMAKWCPSPIQREDYLECAAH